MNNNMFVFSKTKPNNKPLPTIYQMEITKFWKRFFSKKTNFAALILFLVIFVLLISFRIFIKHDPSHSIDVNNDFINNLNPYLSPLVTRNFERGDELNFIYKIRDLEEIRAKNLITDPVFKIFYDSSFVSGGGAKTINTDIITLIYNPYDLLKAIELNKGISDPQSYRFILGTNVNGIDIWSRIWYAIFNTIFILLLATIFNLFIGTFLGSYAALNENKLISKILKIISQVISSVPELIWIVLICALYNGSLLSIFISVFFISWVSFFEIAKQETERLRNLEFILAAKAVGKNNFRIIFSDILSNIFPLMIVLFVEKLAMGILIVSSISFLDFIQNTDFATIGVILKESVQSLAQNPYYFITVIIALSFITLSLKLLSSSIANAYDVKRK